MCAKRYYYGDIPQAQLQNLDVETVTFDPLKVVEFNNYTKSTQGHAGLSFRREQQTRAIQRNTIKGAVYDGDTVAIGAFGNLSTRFIGLDTPEKNFRLLKDRTSASGSDYTGFIRLDDDRWAAFLENPFVDDTSSYLGPGNGAQLETPYTLSPGLRGYLQPNLVAAAARNHRLHADAALAHLERLIKDDLQNLRQADDSTKLLFESEDRFRFYLRFAREVTDGYGRLICILKPDQPVAPPGGREESYNLRMLKAGMAIPYFIWPNVDPFREQEFILRAVIKPGQAWVVAQQGILKTARDYARGARNAGLGVFGDVIENGQIVTGPLQIMPHEIRYLSSMRPPPRYVIDLRQASPWADTLLDPENYYLIPHVEDRLYVGVEYVPLFVKQGWKIQLSAGGEPPVADCGGFCEWQSGIWSL